MTPKRISRLDVAATPLEGVTLIEANAGTGKTWTITALYLRLLLEAGRGVDEILVVTFTDAATAELRDRVRARLADARAAFHRGTAAKGDEIVATLLARLPDRQQALLQLDSALRNFDQAPIYTIHGYCQRVLGDRAFETGMPFATELVPDQSELLQEIVEDYWRTTVHGATPLFARYLAGKGLEPSALQTDVAAYIGKPYFELRGPAEPGDLAGLERTYLAAWQRAREVWPAARETVQAQLVDGSLNGNQYRPTSVPNWLEQMEACLGRETPDLSLFKTFEKFTPPVLTAATKKGRTTPRHPFYEACSDLLRSYNALMPALEARLAGLKMALLQYCNAELATRKAQRQLQSYDDLLLNLERALRDERGPALAEALRNRYTAALIDEFQDTDPVQYGIFERIYRDSGLPVFFVGDPKQSIYSFRGADIFAYLEARRRAGRLNTLDVNWRSEPSLLDAVNRIFENAPLPFLVEEIPFQPSKAAAGDRGRFVIDGDAGAPLELWFAEGEGGQALTKSQACERAADATAAEIARLLALGARNAARIVGPREGERRLRGGDIAVLVRKHDQGKLVREALAKRRVPSVQRGAANVFRSAEADELERVLLAIAEPGRESLVSAALATEMLGRSGEEIHALRADETQWEPMVESFREAHREWHERGFVRMLRAFFQRHDVVCRLLEYADGERRVTNVLHLVERLHCEADTHGVNGLIAWLAEKRGTASNANEEELLRLESDENLVKILTVHVAKGLEFPLVFCPFLWDGALWAEKDAVIRFHDTAADGKAVLDFGSPHADAAREQALREEHAENLRLLYVALTRAKYRCWMMWGAINGVECSAPTRLLHPGRRGGGEGTDPQPIAAAAMRADVERLAQSSEGTIRVVPLATPNEAAVEDLHAGEARLLAREFPGTIRDLRRVTSFTGLAHGRAIEAQDYDAADRYLEPEAPIGGRDIFAFPRGAQAGKCLHAIFEHTDFASLARADLERTVARALVAHGFHGDWVRVVADMVQSVVATPLDASGELRLDRVSRSRRLDELEFYYPIRDLSDRTLRRLLLAGGFPDEIRERIGELTFAPAQGYMRGYIDLVFEHGGRYYLADYKSNWLGATVSAYQQPQLAKAMAREAYYLQYLVYCVALHRYLAARVPGYRYESHFGGVYYLFLRGMRPDAGTCGVYADRPAESLIHTLDDYLRSGTSP